MRRLARDASAYRPGALRASWRRFRRSPIMQAHLWRQLRDYDRPDFHPDDHDTTELVPRWREQLFGDDGTLVGKLVGNTARQAAG